MNLKKTIPSILYFTIYFLYKIYCKIITTPNGKQFEIWTKANGHDDIRGYNARQLNKLFEESKNWQQLTAGQAKDILYKKYENLICKNFIPFTANVDKSTMLNNINITQKNPFVNSTKVLIERNIFNIKPKEGVLYHKE